MPENTPGKKQAVISMVLAVMAFLYLMLVPMYATAFFTLVLGVIGLVQAIRAKRLGCHNVVRAIGLLLSIINVAVSALLVAVLVIALVGGGETP